MQTKSLNNLKKFLSRTYSAEQIEHIENTGMLHPRHNIPKANELKKKFDMNWINEKFQSIKKSESSGKWSTVVGKYSCTEATKGEFVRLLKDNGYIFNYSVNSHGVDTIIVKW